MTDLVEKLRIKGGAEEDVYFAKRDVELIEALREKRLASLAKCRDAGEKDQAEAFQKRFEKISTKHKKKPHKLLRRYRDLLDDIKAACKRRH